MRLVALFLSLFSFLAAHSIVFVHIGPQLPDYLPVAIEQARLFNKECPIYLIGNESAFKRSQHMLDETVQCICCEALNRSQSHGLFNAESKLDRHTFGGFWTFTSERFFYLEELISQYDLRDVFHLENDVMLYTDLSSFLPLFQKNYKGKIGATFDNETRCIPGFVYISEVKPLSELVKLMAQKARSAKNDMEMLQEFKDRYAQVYIDNLPIIFPEYKEDYGLRNALGVRAKNPEQFSQYFTDFKSIFDAAALGQYLGGTSPRNESANPGFINESCFFNPAFFSYRWKIDGENRWVPLLQYKGAEYPINNLHIHSKNLKNFFSRR